ncbi:MAG: hypothetical protein AAGF12_38700 [Myxococcota bacterium]
MADRKQMLYDKRIVERNIRKGLLTKEDYAKHIEGLADAEPNAEAVVIDDPEADAEAPEAPAPEASAPAAAAVPSAAVPSAAVPSAAVPSAAAPAAGVPSAVPAEPASDVRNEA